MSESKRRPQWLFLAACASVLLAAVGVWWLFHARASQAREEVSERQRVQAAGPKVQVTEAKRSAPERAVTLQAEARPFAEVTLYAKVAGYLQAIAVDKGDRVKRGQVLARIEAPELDAQYVAAQADAKYKAVNAKRAQVLVEPGVISAQDRDVAQSNSEVAAATQRSILTQKGYELLRAPFDGTVTARFADPGALLQNAANSQSGSLPILTIAQIDTLRVYGYVDQRDAPFLKVGGIAEVNLTERPGHPVIAKISRLANELDARTRMMLTEVDLDNRDQAIVAGSFVTLTLRLNVPSVVEVPAAALVLRGKSPFVAVVGDDQKIHFQAVQLAEDDGDSARVASGLSEGQRVALNVGDNLSDGATVQPVVSGGEVAKPR